MLSFLFTVLLYALWLVPLGLAVAFPPTLYVRLFMSLFVFRYLRMIVGLYSYLTLKPVPIPKNPTQLPEDVSVIIPTVKPSGKDFEDTVISALASRCRQVLVIVPVADGDGVFNEGKKLCASLVSALGTAVGSKVILLSCPMANKRAQVVTGLEYIKNQAKEANVPLNGTVFLADDHVFWPYNFLQSMLAPFEDPLVAGVACHKRVLRSPARLFSGADFLNLIGCLYLERHNFDLAVTFGIDRSLFVISGRTAAYRASVLCTPEFLTSFTNEYWRGYGPLNADDDNFITRTCVNKGLKLAFQTGPAALMETTLGTEGGFTKFNAQCLRWTRTTWRSNSTSLFTERTVWRSQPWAVYAIYITSFFNFALFIDASLVCLCRFAAQEAGISVFWATVVMAAWIFVSKLVKTFPHYKRNPRDLLYLPGCILFSYYHSLLKLWALPTAGNVAWGSRLGLVK